jgi:membrane protein
VKVFATWVVGFGRDVWNLSMPRIRRADPLLMGAAIAYNSLFALVPLAVAFAAILSFSPRTSDVLSELYALVERTLPEGLSSFLIDILQQSTSWVGSQRGWILAVSLLIALWSGSRAVYAVQKALRAVEGDVEDRGYIRSRGVGIVVTIGATIGILVAYASFTLGSRVFRELTDRVGTGTSFGVRLLLFAIAVVWVWFLLWAIYRWGPPRPMRNASVVAAAVAALLVLGSFIALNFYPANSSAVAMFGAIGVFLIWLYYIGIVIVAAPTVFSAFAGAIANAIRR